MKYEPSSALTHDGPLGLWDGAHDYVRVILRDVQVEARVGMHPWEMHPERPNRLVVNIELFAHLQPGVRDTGDPFINYDHIHDALRTWPARPHVLLLETLVEEVVGLCLRIPRVDACRVSILKPDIFNDASAAGIEVYRRRPA